MQRVGAKEQDHKLITSGVHAEDLIHAAPSLQVLRGAKNVSVSGGVALVVFRSPPYL
jgi:hypothetical protein